jgi:3-deoxy-D-manno-octulosonate 8-phosphate phosphatase (KDO 8-P phosphatase)
MTSTLHERCARIEMLVLDVDGVLTDGRIIYTDDGVEVKAFHVRDGSGLKLWEKAGKRSGIVTGRTSRIVSVRAMETGIKTVVQGAADKLPAYLAMIAREGLAPEQVCTVGDDVTDLPILRRSGLAVAVADACPEVIADAHFVTRACGGCGAVRETIELILKCQGLWPGLIAAYRA